MHIALVYPRCNAKPFPLGLAYLAANAKLEPGDQIEIVDANVRAMSEQDVVDDLVPKSPQIVGLSFMTYNAEYCYRLSQLLKERLPETLIVHGGIHASWLPEDALDHGADVVVFGEGELTFAELVAKVRGGRPWRKIKGIYYRSRDQVRGTEQRPFIQDLDTLNTPDWSMLDLAKYDETVHVVEGRALSVMCSRGCAFDCSFCSSLWKRRVRYRTVNSVIAQFKRDIQRTGIRHFHFYDDNLLLRPKFLQELCQRMVDEQLGIKWCAESRVGSINKNRELLPLLVESGCVGLEMGVESLDDVVLKQINKRQTANDSLTAVRLLKRHHVVPMWQTMTFNTGETIAGHYRQNRAMTRMTNWFGVFWGQFATPFPGSRFYHDAPQTGRVFTKRWSDYVTGNVNYIPNSLLDEVPIRNRARLNCLDLLLCRYGYRDARPKPQGIDYQRLFGLIDGTRTVCEVLDLHAAHFTGQEEAAFQEGAKGILTFAQLGTIRAKGANGHTEPYDLRWSIGAAMTIVRRLNNRLRLMLKLPAHFMA